MRLVQSIAAAFLALSLCVASAAVFDFPPLTGRVVDQAGILSAERKADIAKKTKDLEEKSSIQVVVATVRSLHGSEIEPYATALFNTWRLGQAGKNNGVLLLVAPNERKVRIEVGYGLESTLTNASCATIIAEAIIPRFKAGDFSGGVDRGIDGIIEVLSRDKTTWQPEPRPGEAWSLMSRLWATVLRMLGISDGESDSRVAGGR